MKPTCFTNTSTAVMKPPTCGFHHTIENQFYFDETPMYRKHIDMNKNQIMGVPPLWRGRLSDL